MDVADRVRRKSDRAGRVLVMALCIAPVAAPLLAAGIGILIKEAPGSAQAIAAPEPARPVLRASVEAPSQAIFSPEPMLPIPAPAREAPRVAPQRQARAPLTGTHALRSVTVVDGLRLAAEGMVITLAGIGPTPPGSECKRLDGVVEPCSSRAASRLEILTRGRAVVCDLRESGGEVRGACRAGKIDIADDLVRNGLALRTSERL